MTLAAELALAEVDVAVVERRPDHVLGVVSAPTAVLIRPDGYVAWVGEPADPGLPDALTNWFGPPTAGMSRPFEAHRTP